MAWNEYQTILGEIFADLFTSKDWQLALAAWLSVPSDRTQRDMLRQVAGYKLKPASRELRELTWLLDMTNEVVSVQRNIGIHTTLWSFIEPDGTFNMLPVVSNPRVAKAFSNTQVLKEYAHYERQIRKMLGFAVGIQFVISPRRKGRKMWPERPALAKRAA